MKFNFVSIGNLQEVAKDSTIGEPCAELESY